MHNDGSLRPLSFVAAYPDLQGLYVECASKLHMKTIFLLVCTCHILILQSSPCTSLTNSHRFVRLDKVALR